MEDEQLEEGVHEQDPVGLYGGGVQEDGLGGAVEGVGVQDGLDHHQAVRQVLPQQAGTVEGGLVRGVVEDLRRFGTKTKILRLKIQSVNFYHV